MGGFNEMFGSFVFCVGVEIKKEANHGCLLGCSVAFVRTMRTLERRGVCRGKRVRFLLQMMQLFFFILIGRDATWEVVSFSQYL